MISNSFRDGLQEQLNKELSGTGWELYFRESISGSTEVFLRAEIQGKGPNIGRDLPNLMRALAKTFSSDIQDAENFIKIKEAFNLLTEGSTRHE